MAMSLHGLYLTVSDCADLFNTVLPITWFHCNVPIQEFHYYHPYLRQPGWSRRWTAIPWPCQWSSSPLPQCVGTGWGADLKWRGADKVKEAVKWKMLYCIVLLLSFLSCLDYTAMPWTILSYLGQYYPELECSIIMGVVVSVVSVKVKIV